MSNGKLTVEGKEYSYAEYLQKVLEFVQLKGFNKDAFTHVAALFWDLDKRVQALEEAAEKAACPCPTEAVVAKPAAAKKPAAKEEAAE